MKRKVQLQQPQEPIIIECDELVHTTQQPFCRDRACPCKDDMSPDSLNYRQEYVWSHIDAGFLTYLEADRILSGYAL